MSIYFLPKEERKKKKKKKTATVPKLFQPTSSGHYDCYQYITPLHSLTTEVGLSCLHCLNFQLLSACLFPFTTLSAMCSLVSDSPTPTRPLCPWDFPGKNTGVGCHFLLQGLFLTQGSNLHPLHCRWITFTELDNTEMFTQTTGCLFNCHLLQ